MLLLTISLAQMMTFKSQQSNLLDQVNIPVTISVRVAYCEPPWDQKSCS